MPSPFPGMNPYLEQENLWPDFHQSFIPLIRDALSAQVRPRYIVRIEERLLIRELPSEERFVGRGDVAVARAKPGIVTAGSTMLEAPAYTRLVPVLDIERQGFLEIRSRDDRELVAVVELLSPSNKRPKADREQYLAKRAEVLSSNAHLVEIDLLRGGPRLPFESLPECDYYVMVSRAEDRPQAGIWPIRLRERLPVVPVPLRAPDGHARIDLQEILNRLYDSAGYEDHIYGGHPQPPLSPQDDAWARSLVPQPG